MLGKKFGEIQISSNEQVLLHDQRCLFKCMHQNSMCSQNILRSRCIGKSKRLRGVFPFSTVFISVMGACPPSRAWGLMAGLPGFVSHGSGLNLGAGCQ